MIFLTLDEVFELHLKQIELFGMAAAYLFHIVSNHPFVDGNKRTGTDAAIIFLDMNGFELETDDQTLARVVLGVGQGAMDKTVVAQFIRDHLIAI